MSSKNFTKRETSYLRKGEINSLIREFYTEMMKRGRFPEELRPHWDLLQGLFISAKTVTTESTDEMIAYIVALGEISRYEHAQAE